jgi:hypothetical protein
MWSIERTNEIAAWIVQLDDDAKKEEINDSISG